MSDRDVWRRALDLFEEAVEWPSGTREARLAGLREPPEVVDAVRTLLHADARADATGDVASAADDAPPDERRLPRMVGRYMLVRVIGSGGFGTVYEARTADGTQVAFKELHVDALDGERAARVERERAVLARLDVPGIARLLDSGRDDTGRPYLVMTLVDGLPLDRYCDTQRLTVRERVALVAAVCRAVQAVHQRFIAHLNLKPSNILVTSDGTPVVVDFGTSKLLEQAGHLTTTARLTPAYASPEQLRHEPVSTACDTYSLGLILFELVTGSWPFGDKGSFASTAERMLGRATAGRLHTRVTDATAERMGLASAARVRAELAGDLDVVVHKALAPDAAARYHSAGALGDDLEAWLANRPVSARRPTWRYRAGKALRRHPVAASATAAAVGIIALLAVFGWQQQQRTIAEGQRAQATVDFLYRMLAVASPEVGGQRGMTIGELVARADTALDAEDDLPDDVRAGVRSVLGLVAYHEGQEGAGVDMAGRAADLARASGHAATEVDAVGRLVTLLIYGGRCDEVRPKLAAWAAAMSRVDAATAPEVAIGYLTGRARVAQACDGKLEEAARFTGAAVAQLAALPDTAPRRVVRALVLTHHARTLNGLRRLAEARAAIDEGLRYAEAHPDGVAARLSLLRLRADNAALGEDFATAALALGEAVASAPGHASAFAEVRLKASWARRLAQAGDRSRALAVAREVIAEADRRAPEMAESRWMVLVDVADALYEAGACPDVPALLTAADRLAATGMPADWRTIRLKVEAFCLAASGAHAEAARVAAEALAVGKAYMPAAPAVERRLLAIAGTVPQSE